MPYKKFAISKYSQLAVAASHNLRMEKRMIEVTCIPENGELYSMHYSRQLEGGKEGFRTINIFSLRNNTPKIKDENYQELRFVKEGDIVEVLVR